MPPEVAYAETVRTTIVWLLGNGDVANNVLHWQVGSGATVDQAFANDLASQINDGMDEIGAHIVDEVTQSIIRTQDLRTTPYPTFESLVNTPGTASTDPMPYQMAAVISLRTVHAGRRGRGRVYIPGLDETSNGAQGQIVDDVRGSLNTMAAGWLAIATANEQEVAWGVLSRSNAAIYAVTAHSVDPRWDVQRRRANRRL